jgi:hypothetical protein
MANEPTYERPRERAVGLSPWAERAMRAIIEAVFARAGDDGVAPPPEDRVAWVCREIDDFLSRVSARSYVVVLLSLVAVSLIAPLFAKRLGTLASLPLADRVRALERFEASGLSPALLAVKALASVHYYEHPDAAREVGFDGACMIAGPGEGRAS